MYTRVLEAEFPAVPRQSSVSEVARIQVSCEALLLLTLAVEVRPLTLSLCERAVRGPEPRYLFCF
jgi:hypothetical protein